MSSTVRVFLDVTLDIGALTNRRPVRVLTKSFVRELIVLIVAVVLIV